MQNVDWDTERGEEEGRPVRPSLISSWIKFAVKIAFLPVKIDYARNQAEFAVLSWKILQFFIFFNIPNLIHMLGAEPFTLIFCCA